MLSSAFSTSKIAQHMHNRCLTGLPECILCDGDPEVLAQIVQHAHGRSTCPTLKEGSNHVKQHKGVEHLQQQDVMLHARCVRQELSCWQQSMNTTIVMP